ncbi:YoaK family protein [Allobranchiibius sp. CTAmp26]|uniref:YoaK family protein n=1 Tax=Allobranchiibius sp. CTAmp26 TaxID=2815214 RepID=UPI001AA0B36C|nr:YoaK family protein [Allobranchiibius sp. CTAmp26]MBO1755510.1 DUF1275 domain-containing protein [Allobranchiibius sp. CTAmp26]
MVDLDEHARLGRRRHALVVGLTFVTGAADAMGFLMLGGAFSSVMTGNMVLLGLSIGDQRPALAVTSGTAIISYVVGVILGARVAGAAKPEDKVWPSSVTCALCLELSIVGVFLIMWEATLGDRSNDVKLVMLGVAATALGIQGSAVQRFGVPGLSSTYLTGTLTTVIGSLAARRPVRSVLPSSEVLIALITGSGVGAACTAHAEPLAPVLLGAPLFIVILAGARITKRQTGGVGEVNRRTTTAATGPGN